MLRIWISNARLYKEQFEQVKLPEISTVVAAIFMNAFKRFVLESSEYQSVIAYCVD